MRLLSGHGEMSGHAAVKWTWECGDLKLLVVGM